MKWTYYLVFAAAAAATAVLALSHGWNLPSATAGSSGSAPHSCCVERQNGGK